MTQDPNSPDTLLTDTQWREAKAHLDHTIQIYQSLDGMPGVNVQFALQAVFAPLVGRFEAGERSRDLYVDMTGVE